MSGIYKGCDINDANFDIDLIEKVFPNLDKDYMKILREKMKEWRKTSTKRKR